jgi:glycosyltransferase involved in cell wall biosynthesis
MHPIMVSIVVPTLGRPSLAVLLSALAADPPIQMGWELLLVDDRRAASTPLPVPAALAELDDSLPRSLIPYTRILTGSAAGPAAARNTGWRAARAPWVVFLDDDVRPEPAWWRRLPADLAVPADVGGVQGQLTVPLPAHRRPTDWERTTGGLGRGLWITADMAYRRAALAAVGGFDERFPRAFREDSELAHRVRLAGWRLVRGERRVVHPVRNEGPWVSLRAQRGNADDALLRRMELTQRIRAVHTDDASPVFLPGDWPC